MKNTILIFEDDQGIRDCIKIILEANGFEVIGHETVKDVIDVTEENHPNIILMDLRIPDNGGDWATTELKRNFNTKNIPVLLISANLNLEEVAQQVGADDFLCKPFEIEDLENKISEILKRDIHLQNTEDSKYIKLNEVDSSVIAKIGYDKRSKTLRVLLKSGKEYEYYNVPESDFNGFQVAESKGEYYNKVIKNYNYKEVEIKVYSSK